MPPASAAVVGAAVWAGARRGWAPWQRRDAIVAGGVAALAAAFTGAWFQVRPFLTPFSSTGVLTLGDATFLLPGLLAWAAVRRVGAVALGLLVSSVVIIAVTQPPYPALALLSVPVVAAPAEAWFLLRGPERSRRPRGLVGAGLVMAVASAGASWLLSPGSASDWTVVILQRGLAGVIAGIAAARLATMSRTSLRRRGLTNSADTLPVRL